MSDVVTATIALLSGAVTYFLVNRLLLRPARRRRKLQDEAMMRYLNDTIHR